jgi:hypothetical protein
VIGFADWAFTIRNDSQDRPPPHMDEKQTAPKAFSTSLGLADCLHRSKGAGRLQLEMSSSALHLVSNSNSHRENAAFLYIDRRVGGCCPGWCCPTSFLSHVCEGQQYPRHVYLRMIDCLYPSRQGAASRLPLVPKSPPGSRRPTDITPHACLAPR